MCLDKKVLRDIADGLHLMSAEELRVIASDRQDSIEQLQHQLTEAQAEISELNELNHRYEKKFERMPPFELLQQQLTEANRLIDTLLEEKTQWANAVLARSELQESVDRLTADLSEANRRGEELRDAARAYLNWFKNTEVVDMKAMDVSDTLAAKLDALIEATATSKRGV